MSSTNTHDFLAETKIAMKGICANFLSVSYTSPLLFDPKKHALVVLFTEDFLEMYKANIGYGYATFPIWRDWKILEIAGDCLKTRTISLIVTIKQQTEKNKISQIILQNDSVKNPGILTLTSEGKFIFSIGMLIHSEFDVDEIFDEKKAKFILDEILMEQNKKKI